MVQEEALEILEVDVTVVTTSSISGFMNFGIFQPYNYQHGCGSPQKKRVFQRLKPMDCDNPQFCLVSIYSPIINHQPPSGFEHFSRATHLRSLGILRGVFIKNPQPVDHGPRNFARVTHPDYQGVLCNLFLFQSVQEPCNI